MSKNRKGNVIRAIGLLYELFHMGKLKTDHAVEADIRKILPDAVILNAETGTRPTGSICKRFTIDNKGILFTWEEHQVHGAIFTWTNSENNYCSKLFEYFAKEIGEILKKYHIELDNRLSGSSIYLRNRISDMAGLDASASALEEIYLLLEDYIPKAELRWFHFSIRLWTLYGERELILIEKQGIGTIPIIASFCI